MATVLRFVGVGGSSDHSFPLSPSSFLCLRPVLRVTSQCYRCSWLCRASLSAGFPGFTLHQRMYCAAPQRWLGKAIHMFFFFSLSLRIRGGKEHFPVFSVYGVFPFQCLCYATFQVCCHELICDGHFLCVSHHSCMSPDFVFDRVVCGVCLENMKFLRALGRVNCLSQAFVCLRKSWEAVQQSAQCKAVSSSWRDASLRDFVLGPGSHHQPRATPSSSTRSSSCPSPHDGQAPSPSLAPTAVPPPPATPSPSESAGGLTP